MGKAITLSTSDITWSDGKFVQLGEKLVDPKLGPATVSELISQLDSPSGKPRITIKLDGGSTISWETSVLNASLRDAAQKPKVDPFTSKSISTWGWVGIGGASAIALILLLRSRR